ncbi:membrane protein YczE [Micromonospora chersina]|uniref:membrane protein YczE n=1 Tax=Micromonospora chersina TaxID=47854 RepID=UPI00372323ED
MSTTLPARLVRLLTGLALFGASVALMVRADLGLSSWDVLHQGLARRTGLPLGWIVNGVALLVLLLWFPLRQRPGVGTVANVALVGLALDAVLAVLPPPSALPTRVGLLLLGILLNGVATGLYLGARLGPGPRDGLMTGLAARGLPVGRVRTGIELAVLAVGWLLGGTVGPGTLLYALSIGPLAQFLIPRLAVPAPGRPTPTGVTPPCPA